MADKNLETQNSLLAGGQDALARGILGLQTKVDLLKPDGAIAETFPRGAGGQMNQTVAMTSGLLYMNAIPLNAGQPIASATHYNSVTIVGGTHLWVALFDKARKLLAWSGDDTAPTWVSGFKTIAITKDAAGAALAAYVVPSNDLYYLGIMAAYATTGPSLADCQQAAAVGSALALPPILVGTSDAGLTTTPPATAAALTALAARWRAHVG